ncbi:hypothetical protein, partial [Rhizobium sp. L58/93]|uniref:hypothetical protein n=2 Tax=unclassified Rhizobium TaxID=2613769 RepID=UPI001FFDEC70
LAPALKQLPIDFLEPPAIGRLVVVDQIFDLPMKTIFAQDFDFVLENGAHIIERRRRAAAIRVWVMFKLISDELGLVGIHRELITAAAR